MKNISVLILLAGVVAVFAVAALLLEQESRYSALPYSGGRNHSDIAVELRKTETALHQLEDLHIVGDFQLKASDDLLSAKNAQKKPQVAADDENVFPVPESSDTHTAVSALAEFMSKNAAQNYGGRGYAVPVAGGFGPYKSAEPKEVKPAQDAHQVSFIYISSDIRRAIVDGAFVQEGEVLSDGFNVTAIDSDNMTLTKEKEESSLRVPKSLAVYLGPRGK